MQTINFTEFRRHAKTYFDEVERGETIRVIRHGRAIADLVPVGDAERVPSWQQPALRLRISGASLSQEILEERRSDS